MPDLSVVVISFNTKDITDKCLKNLALSNFKNKQVIVVDNASTDGSIEMIQKKYPEFTLIKSDLNLGFGKANNLGMGQAKGKYILLLNSDAFIQPDTLDKCIEFMENNPDSSVMGCKLTYQDGRLQPSAGALPNPINTFRWIWGLGSSVHPKSPDYFSTSHRVGWVTGAFVFLKKEVFGKTNGFDEKIFMYMEEIEWCKRIKMAGLNVYYTSDFSVVHLAGASSNFDLSPAYTKEMHGLVYYFEKHYHGIWKLMKLIIKGGNLARSIAFNVIGNHDRAKIYSNIAKSL
jgi:N-acetylglucosaminyl-diphospho-decaprenol L-rhamnosyltransferase